MSVPVSASSHPLHSRCRTCVQWLVVLSTSPLNNNQCSHADVFGQTARVMASLCRSKAICTSCSHLCWRAFADICSPIPTGRDGCCVLHRSRNTWGMDDRRLSKPTEQQVSMFYHGKSHILHTFLRLLRKH